MAQVIGDQLALNAVDLFRGGHHHHARVAHQDIQRDAQGSHLPGTVYHPTESGQFQGEGRGLAGHGRAGLGGFFQRPRRADHMGAP